ncbi:hypothetical protein [Ammoniphilus sp. YIM 78166]|uniref:hypothetical protein n=1 Tax=Ammoniphilus sp. YIM 78166 TaxID=1644106 RepID=UPI00106FD361|nr:hypothetical protein [Ammoniphilus sp. YIM 78166]
MKKITLPFTPENLKSLLTEVISKQSTFTHQDLAEWCWDYTVELEDVDFENEYEYDAISVARDIECQWDLYLCNSYKWEELQNLDMSNVLLPYEWFVEWLNKLESVK